MGGWICTERSFSVGNYRFVTEKLAACYREALRAVLEHRGGSILTFEIKQKQIRKMLGLHDYFL